MRILGEKRYLYPIRSILKAGTWPDGTPCVLVEADYKMAEMAFLGWMAQDPQMMEHVRRNTLSKKHPDFIDLHALTAINAFQLDTPENRALCLQKGVAWGPTKAVLEALGRVSLRVAAKNVNFGVPYQRSAEAIARQCREEGADVTVEQAQELIDNYFKTYPQIAIYLSSIMDRVVSPGWICGAWGHHRRAQPLADSSMGRDEREKKLGEMKRQFCNFPIQNGVAGAINLACNNLYRYREKHGVPASNNRWFSFCLQIHDALLFEVPVPALQWFLTDVLKPCMSDAVDIIPRDFDGNVMQGVGPYHLDIDTEVMQYWGVPLQAAWAAKVGVPDDYYKKAA